MRNESINLPCLKHGLAASNEAAIAMLAIIAAEEELELWNQERFINFMAQRFPGKTSEDYVREWANRFRKGFEYEFGDRDSVEILLYIDNRLGRNGK